MIQLLRLRFNIRSDFDLRELRRRPTQWKIYVESTNNCFYNTEPKNQPLAAITVQGQTEDSLETFVQDTFLHAKMWMKRRPASACFVFTSRLEIRPLHLVVQHYPVQSSGVPQIQNYLVLSARAPVLEDRISGDIESFDTADRGGIFAQIEAAIEDL